MQSNFQPWERYSALTEERLVAVANVIRRVRGDAVNLHDSERGDDEWSLGCRTYTRTCFALREAAKTNEWLTILKEDAPLAFSFAIGSIPFRFYRGDPSEPPGHYRITSYAELRQHQLLLNLGVECPEDQTLRLAVETGGNRLVSCVTLVVKDLANRNIETYVVPETTRRINVQPLKHRGFDPGAPRITVKEQKVKSEDTKQYKGE